MNEKKILELFSLEGRVAIVTGGAGRLGIKHAEILYDAGAYVVSFDVVKNDRLSGIAEQVIVDITKRAEVFNAVDELATQHGQIDILINNAAFNPKVSIVPDSNDNSSWAPYEEFPIEQFQKELAVGLIGAQNCTQAVARHMIPHNSGSIINIGSTSAITVPDHRKYKQGRYKSVAYPVVKAAVVQLARAWASYFSMVAPNVRCNALSPGSVNFGSMEPEFLAKLGQRNMLGRPAQPDEYKGVILFLCSDASSFLTASALVADGGQTVW